MTGLEVLIDTSHWSAPTPALVIWSSGRASTGQPLVSLRSLSPSIASADRTSQAEHKLNVVVVALMLLSLLLLMLLLFVFHHLGIAIEPPPGGTDRQKILVEI